MEAEENQLGIYLLTRQRVERRVILIRKECNCLGMGALRGTVIDKPSPSLPHSLYTNHIWNVPFVNQGLVVRLSLWFQVLDMFILSFLFQHSTNITHTGSIYHVKEFDRLTLHLFRINYCRGLHINPCHTLWPSMETAALLGNRTLDGGKTAASYTNTIQLDIGEGSVSVLPVQQDSSHSPGAILSSPLLPALKNLHSFCCARATRFDLLIIVN